MAELETEYIFNGSLDKVFAGLKSYEDYPKYIPGVTKIDVLPAKAKGSTCQVRYELNVIKKVFYVLNMYEEAPHKIWWDLDDSNLLKSNVGGWTLSSKDKTKTHAVYRLDLKFKGLVPSMVTDQVAKANLPGMLEGFQKLIQDKN